MAWNLNYPDYSEMGMKMPAGPQGMAAGAAPQAGGMADAISPYASLGTSLIGTALNAYGSYEQSQDSRAQYEQMVRAWQADQDRQARLDADNKNQQYFTDALATAQYGQGVKKDAASQYGTYAKAYGL